MVTSVKIRNIVSQPFTSDTVFNNVFLYQYNLINLFYKHSFILKNIEKMGNIFLNSLHLRKEVKKTTNSEVYLHEGGLTYNLKSSDRNSIEYFKIQDFYVQVSKKEE